MATGRQLELVDEVEIAVHARFERVPLTADRLHTLRLAVEAANVLQIEVVVSLLPGENV
jgi:hypothetical protein